MSAASAQYVVDVAIAMPAGAATAAELDTLSQQLLKSGASADNFHDAVVLASNALAAAKQASLAANAALGAGNTAYKDLEQAALQASKAQEKAARLGVVPPSVAANAAAASAAVNEYATKLAALEAAATGAAADEAKLAKQLTQVQQASAVGTKALAAQGSAAQEADRNLKKLKGGLAGFGGPIGALGAGVADAVDNFHDLEESLGSSGAKLAVVATGAGIAAAAVAAVTVVVLAATVAIAAWAIGLADTNREYALTLEATEVLNPSLEKLHGTIDALGNQTGLAEQQIDGIAIALKEAHVAARDMPAALEAASEAEAALGTGGAAQFIQRMQASGKSVQAFSATVSSQLEGVVAKKLLGLSAQAGQFKQNIGTLFGSFDIEPALRGLQKLVALFDENTAAGQAIKLLFGAVFKPLIDNAENAATVIEAFALGFLIGLTKTYLAVKPAIKAVTQFFGFHDASLSNTLATVTKAAEYIAPVVVVLVVAFTALVAIVGAAAAALTAGGLALVSLPAIVIAAALALGGVFLNAWHAVSAFLSNIDLATVGHDIITGLVNGLLAAGPAVLHAISGVVSGAIDGAKHLLGIASPSKVFGEIGVNTVAGYVNEVNAGAGEAQAAAANMVAPPDAPTSALAQQTAQQAPRVFGGAGGASSAGGSSSSSSKSISLTGPFIFNGVTGVEDIESRFGELLTRAIEGDATQLGASPEQAAA